MQFNWPALKYGLVLAGMDVLAFPFVKHISLGGLSLGWMIVPTIFYALDPYILLQSMRFEGLAIMNLLWNMMSNILIIFIGVYLFEERITLLKWIGISLSLVSICLLSSV